MYRCYSQEQYTSRSFLQSNIYEGATVPLLHCARLYREGLWAVDRPRPSHPLSCTIHCPARTSQAEATICFTDHNHFLLLGQIRFPSILASFHYFPSFSLCALAVAHHRPSFRLPVSYCRARRYPKALAHRILVETSPHAAVKLAYLTQDTMSEPLIGGSTAR